MKLRQRRLRSVAATVLASAMLSSGAMVWASAPASAALHTCNYSDGALNRAGYYGRYPTYYGGSVETDDCLLGRGTSGEPVKILQRHLRTCNGQDLTVDGIFGAQTEQAVRNVQARYGLTRDGIYGPNTRNKMRWYATKDGEPGKCFTFSAFLY